MEAIFLRFPHLEYQIFEQLDNLYLTIGKEVKEVSELWQSFIDNEKLPWIRMIMTYQTFDIAMEEVFSKI